MAIRKPETTPTSTETALAPSAPPDQSSALAIFGDIPNLIQASKPDEGEMFTQLYIPHPVQVDGQKFRGIDANQIGFYDGSRFEPIQAPILIYKLAARDATRKTIETVDDKGKPKKTYERAFKPMAAGYDKSGVLYEQHLHDSTAERGAVYVVAVVKDGNVAICEISAFKVQKDLWGFALNQAQDGRACKVKLTNLESTLTPTKNDPQKKYTDPKKFLKHTEIVELDRDTLIAIKNAMEPNMKKLDSWLRK